MDRRAFAVWIVSLGLIAGILGNIFFYGQRIGVSFPLFTLIIILMTVLSAQKIGLKVRLRNLWLLIPIMFFAVMFAVRANPQIATYNMLAVFGLGALTLYYLPLEQALDEEGVGDHVVSVIETAVNVSVTPGVEFSDSMDWLRERGWRDRHFIGSVVRGAVITLPIVIVFAILLGSADAVFAGYLDNFSGVFDFSGIPTLIARAALLGFLAWITTGIIVVGVARRPVRQSVNADSEQPAEVYEGELDVPLAETHPDALASPIEKNKPPAFQMGIIESAMLLGSVALLFSAFTLIQFAYFFGGQDNISVEGYTYAEYARRGFFELLAVSVMTLALVLTLDWITVRRNKRHHQIVRSLSVVIVALIMVMILSASQRMELYEDAFGFTHLRVYVHVFILWLGGLFLVFLMSLFRLKRNVFSLGILIAAIGFLATINIINIDRYIAERNINRYRNGRQLDVCYLRQLSVDALPAMLNLREIAGESDAIIAGYVDSWLATQLYHFDRSTSDDSIFAFNLALDNAKDELEPMRTHLNALAQTTYSSCYGVVRRMG
jgi:hypothetical protein